MTKFCFCICLIIFFFVSIQTSSSSPSSSSSPYLSPTTFTKNYNKMLVNLKLFIYQPVQHIAFSSPSASLFYKSLINSAFVTREPEEAHLFFVPVSPGTSKRALARLVRELRTRYTFWNRTLGADHFFISPEGIEFSSDRNALELKKNSVQISVFPTVSGNFIPHKDISLPPARTPELKLISDEPVNGTVLGFLNWDGRTEAELVNELKLDDDFLVESEPSNHVERAKNSKFCLFFYSDGSLAATNSMNIATAMSSGCVPVVIVDRPVQDFPLMDVLRWSEMVLLIGNRRGADGVKAVLGGVTVEKYEKMRELCVAAGQHMVWNDEPQPYDAFHMVIYQLWMRRHTIRYTRREEF
ncbi:hypothetical protein BC332_29491 [Capsicum chinense]|nr:hypothetical protein BC332_29491 [Capsicum chinense]